ncbi:MAG: hypothetical protein JWM48_2541 [Mycobacterium sp.]|nr:hypothetical protein [Mycobacterium sp.]
MGLTAIRAQRQREIPVFVLSHYRQSTGPTPASRQPFVPPAPREPGPADGVGLSQVVADGRRIGQTRMAGRAAAAAWDGAGETSSWYSSSTFTAQMSWPASSRMFSAASIAVSIEWSWLL